MFVAAGANLVTSTTAATPIQSCRQSEKPGHPLANPVQHVPPDLWAKSQASQLPVPLVSQGLERTHYSCHPNSPWQPPPLHLLGVFLTFCSSAAHYDGLYSLTWSCIVALGQTLKVSTQFTLSYLSNNIFIMTSINTFTMELFNDSMLISS